MSVLLEWSSNSVLSRRTPVFFAYTGPVPRVSAQHLDERRQQIVAAAVRCFARAGVHGTTMQDVFAESAMSPGGVYRYFKSKDDLILAIAHGVAAQLDALLTPVKDATAADSVDPPRSVGEEVSRLIAVFDSVEGDENHRRVAMAIWSESLYHPGVAAVITDIVGRLTLSLASRLAVLQDMRRLDADLDPHSAAQVLIALLPGYLLQRVWFPNLEPEAFTHTSANMFPGPPHDD